MRRKRGVMKMNESLRKLIIIKTKTEEEESAVMESIHNQLVGNPDYIECRIILNNSSTRNDGTKNEVHVYIFNDSESNPQITII